MTDREKDIVADCYYIEGYARVVATAIKDGTLNEASKALVDRMAELAHRVHENVKKLDGGVAQRFSVSVS